MFSNNYGDYTNKNFMETTKKFFTFDVSWLDTNLSRHEPEEEDLVPASSDEGLWQRSKRQK